MRELPDGWTWTTLGEICSKPQYGWTTKGATHGRIKLLRTTDIAKDPLDWPSVPFCAADPPEPEKYLLADGDIVISRAGSVGVSALLQRPIPAAVFASYLVRFRALGGAPRYISSFLDSPAFWAAISHGASGIAMPNVNAKKLAALRVPFAPLPEQHRIAGRVESLFAKLDDGIDALKRAETNLKRYRASVLQAAVEGRLTARWRKENPPDETGEELLRRILAERRKRWEKEQLAKFAEKGREPPQNWKSKYKAPVAPDTTELPELPEGWCWATVDQVGWVVSGQTPKGAAKLSTSSPSAEVPWYRVGDMTLPGNERVLRQSRTYFTADEATSLGLKVLPAGAIVFPKRGGAIATNKKRELGMPSCIDLNVMAVIPSPGLRTWVWWWFQSVDLAAMADGSNVPQINYRNVRPLALPVPPAQEQEVVVEDVVTLLKACRKAQEAAAGPGRLMALRQSVLKRAFEGRLVPQDPADEPASVLLDRIRAKN